LHGVVRSTSLRQNHPAGSTKSVVPSGACGAVKRNVMCCPAQIPKRFGACGKQSPGDQWRTLTPHTRGYYEIGCAIPGDDTKIRFRGNRTELTAARPGRSNGTADRLERYMAQLPAQKNSKWPLGCRADNWSICTQRTGCDGALCRDWKGNRGIKRAVARQGVTPVRNTTFGRGHRMAFSSGLEQGMVLDEAIGRKVQRAFGTREDRTVARLKYDCQSPVWIGLRQKLKNPRPSLGGSLIGRWCMDWTILGWHEQGMGGGFTAWT